MLTISPEDKAILEHHLQQAASILKQYTESQKLKDFESIEVELRTQMLTLVSPTIAEVFFSTPPIEETTAHHQKSGRRSQTRSQPS